MFRAVFVVVLAGCGRIGFEPVGAIADAHGDADDAAMSTFGPVAWFKFEGPPYIDSIGGMEATCLAPECPIDDVGYHDQGIRFDADDDCLRIPDGPLWRSQRFTIAIWANQRISGAMSQVSKCVGAPAGQNNSFQLESNGTDQLSFTSSHASSPHDTMRSPDGTIHLGVWQHLALTWDGTRKRLFIDGQPQGMADGFDTMQYDANEVRVGCDNNGNNAEPYDGSLDDLQLYDRVLTDQELLDLAGV